MRPTTPRPAALTSSLLPFLCLATVASPTWLSAQSPSSSDTSTAVDGKAKTPAGSSSKQGNKADGAAAADDITAGLPKFLRLVPGGTVEMGITADELAEIACQTVAPDRPDAALKRSEDKVKSAMRQSASLLGRQTVPVETYLLAMRPTTNAEYEAYIKVMRDQKKRVRVPFHWWRFGREDHYTEVLPEISKQYPKDPLGPLNYWWSNGHELPYRVTDSKGESIADLPVNHVSWGEANVFAAWMGMRLPSEAEWTRAARGNGKDVWPCGAPAFTESLLKELQQNSSRNQVLKPVGTVQAAAGPFGHADMFGQIWQLVADLGYTPISGKDAFASEWKRVGKHKVASLLESPPIWDAGKALAKGGSYLSHGDPVQLLVDGRAPMLTIDVMESVGIRLAKSLRPGYDMLFSLLRGVFNRGALLEGQDIDLTLQVGGERYELGPTGFPVAYHAVSFAPVNWLTNDKSMDLNKLLDRSQEAPVLIGSLATSANIIEPAMPAGHYLVTFRREGEPRELTEAKKAGWKEVQAEKRRREKAGKKDEEAKEDEQDKTPRKGSWQAVLPRYGLTEQDLENAAQYTDIKFVRIDGVEVSTETDTFLLYDGIEGKVSGVLTGTKKKPSQGNPFSPSATVEANAAGRARFVFRIGAPVQMQNAKRFFDVQLPITLDLPAPSAEKPWRLPPQE